MTPVGADRDLLGYYSLVITNVTHNAWEAPV